jgi:sodium/proline symporter
MDYAGFLLFLAAFGGIGLWSARLSRRNESDFLLACRSVSPFLTAPSAAATKYSGYMAMGLIGYPAVDRPQ